MQSGSLLRLIFSGMVMYVLASCNDQKEVPFPVAESGFARPVSRAFQLSAPEAIQWKVISPDSIRELPVTHFDYNKIPSRPFDIGGPRALASPITEKRFDLAGLKDTAFNLKSLPTHSIKYRTVLLGDPKVVKAGLPGLAPGATRGIMSLGTDMGMPAFTRCFLQDANGLMWIGTDKGLFRYDGQTLINYGIEQGLTDMDIYSLAEDNDNHIWIGGAKSVQVINRKAGLISQVIDSFAYANVIGIMKSRDGLLWMTSANRGVILIDPAKRTVSRYDTGSGLPNNFTLRSVQDSSGLIWITTGIGLNILDLKKGTSRKLGNAEGLNGQTVFSLWLDNDQRIWAGMDSGVTIIDNGRKTMRHIGTAQGLSKASIVAIAQDGDGLTWLGTVDGKLFSVNDRQGMLEKFDVTDVAASIIYNIFKSSDNQLWIGSIRGGGYLINPANGRPGNFSKANGLTDNRVWAVKEDADQRIWIGTYNGIDIYEPSLRVIKHLGRENGLITDRTTTLYEVQPGEVWATGSVPAISIINIAQGTIKKLSAAEGLLKDSYSSIVKDRSGAVWLGTDQGNLIMVDMKRKLIKSFKPNQGSGSSEILSLIEDKKGRIWAGSLGGGAFIIDPAKNTVRHFGVSEGLLHEQVTTFMEDKKGNVWIGSEGGINIADIDRQTLMNLTMKEGMASKGCYTIDQVDSFVYVGTSAGITVFPEIDTNRKNWIVKTYGKGQGLAFIDFAQNSSLVTHNKQYLAGIDNQVLTVLNTLKGAQASGLRAYVTGINLFDKPQRFSTRSFFDREIKDIDTLWKAENATYYANKAAALDSARPVGAGIHWDSTTSAYDMPVNLQLPYDQNYLSFNFNGTHLANADKARYRYILQGIDKNWSPITEKSTSENYRNLAAGTYVFKVSSAGMNGVWTEPSEFTFTINPPVWKTWWAYTIYLLLAGFTVWSLAKYRLRSLERQNKVLEEKVTMRTEALNKSLNELKATQSQLIQSEKMASLGELTAGIAHEIQNPLNFVNNFSEINAELIAELQDEIAKGNQADASAIAQHISENESKISHHGKRAEAIVRSMLQHSRSGSVQKEPTDINALADEYFRLSFHGLRARDKSFQAGMHTDFQEGLGLISIRGQDIGRVLLNLVNNAFYAVSEKARAAKRSGQPFEPMVSVSTRALQDGSGSKQVLIAVRDNGNGIPARVLDKIFQPFFTTKPTGEGTGLGLSLAYDIIRSHGGVLSVDTREGEYTEFQIVLPVA